LYIHLLNFLRFISFLSHYIIFHGVKTSSTSDINLEEFEEKDIPEDIVKKYTFKRRC